MMGKVPARVAEIPFTLNGQPAMLDESAGSLLEGLRQQHQLTSVKDGCSPQGQCGCCTVWIDGSPRVACVTPIARVRGRTVTTVEGLPEAHEWATAFATHGASQCGFCTPGIIMRLAALAPAQRDEARVRSALLAHLCRCTGWQTIVEAATDHHGSATPGTPRNDTLVAARARLEGGSPQRCTADTALGHCGFAADTAPPEAAVALRSSTGEWVSADTPAGARQLAGIVQGRRTTAPLSWPIEPPPGTWQHTLQTTWVEPAALETDTSWCAPDGEPATALANGGAFGAKQSGWIESQAALLATTLGRPVAARLSREDSVRLGPKRPPMAIAVAADGTGHVVVARTPGIVAAIHAAAPDWTVTEVDVPGPSTSAALRGAGWAEIAAVRAALAADEHGLCTVRTPAGAVATAAIDDRGVRVTVRCGPPLDPTILRSYCIGAAHMALGWVRSEALTVDDNGLPLDLTIRSFGILRATETPPIDVVIEPDGSEPVNGSDAVFAAVAAAAWLHAGLPARWPTMRP